MSDDDNSDESPRGLVGLATSRGGWFSGLCLSLWGLSGVIFDLIPSLDVRAPTLNTDLGHLFLGMAAVSIALKMKSNSDLVVKSEAEKRIQDPGLASASVIAPIQAEIDKQMTQPPATVPAADVLNAADRKTPLVGVPTVKD